MPDVITRTDLENAKVDVEDLADIVNGAADDPAVSTRLGLGVPTIASVVANGQAMFNSIFAAMGYEPPVAHGNGLSITRSSQTVEYLDQIYAPLVSALPFVTTGVFDTAKWRLITVPTHVSTIAGLAALAALDGYTIQLTQPGREGTFIFNDDDLSAEVSYDPLQGLYVAPALDADGSSGAWVRVLPAVFDVRLWGAAIDGATDDYAEIQAAVNAVSALGGGIVEIPVGTARTSLAIVLQSNMILQGRGMKASIIEASARVNGSIIQIIGETNVHVRDLGMTGISDTVLDRAEHGVYADNSTDVLIERVWIDDPFTWAVFILTCTNAGVSHCVIDGSQLGHGVEINAGPGTDESHGCFVEYTTIRGTYGNNIEIYAQGGRCFDSRIEGNWLLGMNAAQFSGSTNLVCYGDIGTRVIGNTMRDGVSSAFIATSSQIDANLLSERGVLIGNQLFDAKAYGLLLSGSHGWTIDSNNILRSGTVGTPAQGVFIQDDDTTFTNNTVLESWLAGGYVQNADRFICIGNHFLDNSQIGVNSQSGLQIDGGTGAIITGNNCSDTRGGSARQTIGIFLQVTTFNVVTGNQCNDNITTPIYNLYSGGGGNIVEHNLPDDGIVAP